MVVPLVEKVYSMALKSDNWKVGHLVYWTTVGLWG